LITCDVAILGAGPAGAIAGVMLARAGLTTILVSCNTVAEVTARRGETLSAGATKTLMRLGLTERIEQLGMPIVPGFASTWGSTRPDFRSSLLAPEAATFVVDRSRLDDALREAASLSGAKILSGRAERLERSGDRWLVSCRECLNLRARWVVDATGRGARFARQAGARRFVLDKLLAMTAIVDHESDNGDRTVRIEALRNGWLFTTRDALGDRVISFFTDGDIWLPGELRHAEQLLNTALAQSRAMARLLEFKRRARIRIWPAATLILDRAVTANVLAVGDAAQTRDPLSSQGISAAIADAESGAMALVSSIGGNAAAMQQHEHRRRRDIARYLAERHQYYCAETRWRGSPFWRRRQDFLLPGLAGTQRGADHAVTVVRAPASPIAG